MEETTYYPGTRVMVFDSRLFKNDKDTPLSFTIRPGTVTKWYGYESERFGKYPSLIDVKFDHREEISRAHFANEIYVKVIN